jgi:hypothetical protein
MFVVGGSDLIEQPVGAALNRDISQVKGERAEKDIDAFITKRHNSRIAKEGDERAVEAVWREAERKEEAKRLEDWNQRRLSICEHLQNVYTKLADEHGREAQKLRGDQPKGAL